MADFPGECRAYEFAASPAEYGKGPETGAEKKAGSWAAARDCVALRSPPLIIGMAVVEDRIAGTPLAGRRILTPSLGAFDAK